MNFMNKNKKINFSTAIKQAMHDALRLDKKVFIYGLGVGTSGNIYGTTKGFKEKSDPKPCIIELILVSHLCALSIENL